MAAPALCVQCGTQLAPTLLACPSCQRLVYSEELKRLATTAEQAAHAGDWTAALGGWRQALDLLPPDSSQHQVISARIAELSRVVDGGSSADATRHGSSKLAKGTAGASVVGALLLKFKFALVFVLTKAKLLLLGLTKGGTLFSMLLSAGAYWTIGGWVNLFNLTPVWQLDGARGFRALTQAQRWGAVAVIALAWVVTKEGLLLLVLVAAAAAAGWGRAPQERDQPALLQYGFLVGVLSLLTRIGVPTVPR